MRPGAPYRKPNDIVRWGIVGLTDVAREAHAKPIVKHPGAKLVAVADDDLERADSFAAAFGCNAYSSLREMAQAERLDVVSICGTVDRRAERTIEAHRTFGLPTLVHPKPPARNLDEARAMAEAARTSGKVLMLATVYRYMVPTVLHACTYERLGQVYLGELRWTRRQSLIGSEPGQRAFIELGIDPLDLTLWLMGYPRPHAISGFARNANARRTWRGEPSPWQIEEDLGVATIDFVDRRLRRLWVHTAYAANVPADEAIAVHLNGETGGVEIPLIAGSREPRDHVPRMSYEENGVLWDSMPQRPLPPTLEKGYADQIADMIACVRGERSPITKLDELITLQLVIDGFSLSASHDGRTIEFDSLARSPRRSR